MRLQLAVKEQYFNEMKAGTKTEEYRKATEYWENRLFKRGTVEPNEFDCVVITQGYPKGGDPEKTLVFEFRGWKRKTITHPHFGPDPVEVFAIDVSCRAALERSEG
ncbi:MAG: ASCH domain-containing protein [Agrobacterium cavarae]|uniref:ASCH domain-containing protein n=1 Tax=Agrobacterium cavarae TaxID=2528239 RepID=UPI00319FA707